MSDRLHPLIRELFVALPDANAEWPALARMRWLRAAAAIVDLIWGAPSDDFPIRIEKADA